jgi:hypothetical protein
MNIRWMSLVLVAATLLPSGCRKPEPLPKPSPPAAQSASAAAPKQPTAPAMDLLASLHWLGMERIAADTNASALMTIWNLPESARLRTQTLAKLSLVPWRLLAGSRDTNVAARLRPLLDDLLQCESYLEIWQATNQPGHLAFAIRLDDAHAAVWETNLAAALQSLTGVQPLVTSRDLRAWVLRKHEPPNLIETIHAKGWTLIGAAQDHNAALDDLLFRIQQTQLPFPAPLTNRWLTAAVDLARVSQAFPWGLNVPAGCPRVSLDLTGDAQDVWAYGALTFPRPLTMELEPWNIPTNLVGQPLTSFTAVRGLRPWLSTLKAWNDLHIGPPPDQFFSWSVQANIPMTYFAVPLANASNVVSALTDLVLRKSREWFGTNDLVEFVRSERYHGLEWRGFPYISPFLQSVEGNGGFVFGGVMPGGLPAEPFSPALLKDLLTQTNLVLHDWESTAVQTESWIYLGQAVRSATQRLQLPPGSAGLLWLKAAAPKLGSCVSQIYMTGPSQLSFTRKSTLCLTGFELQLLADWLESPDFPFGLYSTSSSPPTIPSSSAPAP